MRVFLTTIAIVLVTLTSCQKDYYLNDLTDAQAEIERLESLNMQKQNTIAELEENIAEDKQLIADLNSEINGLYNDVESLEGLNSEQVEQIAGLKLQLEETLSFVADLTDELNELIIERDELVAELNASNDENVDLTNRVSNLQGQITSLKIDLNTESDAVSNLNTIIMNLRQEIAGLNNVIGQDYEEAGGMTLVPTVAPSNKPNGSFFTIGITGVVVQVYGHAGAERHVPFTVDAQGNNAQPIGGNAQLYRIDRDDLEGAPYSIERAIYLANNVDRYNG